MYSCIFDFDGTLVDSMSIWAELPRQYLARYGVVPKDDFDIAVATLSMKDCCRYFINEYGIDGDVENMRAQLNIMVEDEYRYNILAKDNVIPFIKALKGANVKMCIATASDKYLIESCLERLGIAYCFEFIATCTDLDTTKTEPKIFQWCIEQLGAEMDNCLVFEDAEHAIMTCRNMGLKTVAMWDKSNEKVFDKIKTLANHSIKNKVDYDLVIQKIIKGTI